MTRGIKSLHTGMPAASFGECVGKQEPPVGRDWPVGFCLMCKGTGENLVTGQECVMCMGNGMITKRCRSQLGVKRDRGKDKKWVYLHSESSWLHGIQRFSSSEYVSLRKKHSEKGLFSWVTTMKVTEKGTFSARIFSLRKSRKGDFFVLDKSLLRVCGLGEYKDDVVSVAEGIVQKLEAGKKATDYPKKILLYWKVLR